MNKTIVVGISGASGVIYGVRLVHVLLQQSLTVYAIVSPSAWQVIGHEMDFEGSFETLLSRTFGPCPHSDSRLHVCRPDDLFAAPASGSFQHEGMVICPCSMKTLGAVSTGLADNLLLRAADVTLKEKGPLILVVRETPFNRVHLKNMLAAAEAGATIMPASPGFYQRPAQVQDLLDFMVARICDHLGVAHQLLPPWGSVPTVV